VVDGLWREVRPEVVIAFDPQGPLPFGNNPDHLAVGAAVLSRARRGIVDGQRVYYYGSPQPNVLVDITEVLQEKTNALRAHRTQLFGPDWLSGFYSRTVSRLWSGRVPAMYTESLYRLI